MMNEKNVNPALCKLFSAIVKTDGEKKGKRRGKIVD